MASIKVNSQAIDAKTTKMIPIDNKYVSQATNIAIIFDMAKLFFQIIKQYVDSSSKCNISLKVCKIRFLDY